ncbi:hypothetical protein PQR71_18050 [Paraburkholderia fungorum]|uniref:hypothetical protein n=1 Tax=Paraburkholderia fungorum TaxID=134537 RepID=UPI0038B830B7
MKALFLGAGASYECGMPLVWEFTNGLRMNVLKRLNSHLFDFRRDPSLRTHLEALLSAPELHYEQMIGELEALYLQRGLHSDVAYTAARQLLDCVQVLLLEDQLNTTAMFGERAKTYSGIRDLLARHPCLHVFSLNHDINFEEICKFHGVPYRDGFFDDAPQRYSNIARFKTLTASQMGAGKLNFYGPEDTGVNLIKLHGSLDVFAVEDKQLYLKCIPEPREPLGAHVLEVLKVEAHSREVCQRMQSRTVGELNVNDLDGELQFLRRSLLSGAQKFKGTFDQIAPLAFFHEFRTRMEDIVELDVIGYGFGDPHINEVLAQWLKTVHTSLTIYDPYRKSVPPELGDAVANVRIRNIGLTDYLNEAGNSKQPLLARGRRYLLDMAREDLRKRRLSVWQADT